MMAKLSNNEPPRWQSLAGLTLWLNDLAVKSYDRERCNMSHQWYFVMDDQKRGPLTDDELKERAASGKLGLADLVWRQGLPEWVEAQTIEGLTFPNMPSTAGGQSLAAATGGGTVDTSKSPIGTIIGCVLVLLGVASFCAHRYGLLDRWLHRVPGKEVAVSAITTTTTTDHDDREANKPSPPLGKATAQSKEAAQTVELRQPASEPKTAEGASTRAIVAEAGAPQTGSKNVVSLRAATSALLSDPPTLVPKKGDFHRRTLTEMFRVDRNGGVADPSDLPHALQGKWHPEMQNWPRFSVNALEESSLEFLVEQHSKTGGVIECYVDDRPVERFEFPGNGQVARLSKECHVRIPSGQHRIQLRNTGKDWVAIGWYRFRGHFGDPE